MDTDHRQKISVWICMFVSVHEYVYRLLLYVYQSVCLPFARMPAWSVSVQKGEHLGSTTSAVYLSLLNNHFLNSALCTVSVWVVTIMQMYMGTPCGQALSTAPEQSNAHWRLTWNMTKTDFVACVGELKEPSLWASRFDCVCVHLCVGW